MVASVLAAFDIPGEGREVTSFGSGLINNTWLVNSVKGTYILQRINHAIFKSPEAIAYNIKTVAAWLLKYYPTYLFTTPLQTKDGNEMYYSEKEGYFRIFPYVQNSHTIDVVTSPVQAYEAAKQFGQLTKLLSGFDANLLKNTLPDFHNLPLRYKQFEHAIDSGNKGRVENAEENIRFLREHRDIVASYEHICNHPQFKRRVTHHDTKISNVLFNKDGKGLCVIDLDTLMSGYFISDVGDMLRTYLSPVSEEERDFSKIEIREDYFKAIAAGYLSEMNDELTEIEKAHFVYAGKFMIYMQALRFLTDYLNDDRYYGAKYEQHNLIRANNQICLLQKLIAKQDLLVNIIGESNKTTAFVG